MALFFLLSIYPLFNIIFTNDVVDKAKYNINEISLILTNRRVVANIYSFNYLSLIYNMQLPRPNPNFKAFIDSIRDLNNDIISSFINLEASFNVNRYNSNAYKNYILNIL